MLMTALGIICLILSAMVAADYALVERAIRQREATIATLTARSVYLERQAIAQAAWSAGQ